MDWDILKKLIQLVKDEDISGVAIEEKGVKYEVRREKGHHALSLPVPLAVAPLDKANAKTQVTEEEEGVIAITSPMVGTFYRAPSPEAPSFVETGDEVEPGKVVFIIEAMNIFNEIEAEVRGKIVKVLVENGKPVEYGQKLFLIKKP
ncbi:acetyl-CoA carboxylase biotin carboxyl carrier protein [Candidatus Saganbacteria bacterium]|uniref:Biotin carboxyl carrier protein of acetyl-CoA carboxylase n=1 Tax=Candidatus Saganbacteria bacterium TaxID=2575572 RepID=A0A9D6YVX0_UNCSA|nr:acetyl-CoA carboxylase biotin carboxyl carrier protein [Candidatus Saganbacteria bacterium]